MVHRSTHVSYADLTVVDRIMCTTVLRTMLDLAGIVDDEALEHVVARGLTARKTTAPRLLRFVDSSFAGRRGGTALRAAASQYTRRRAETASRLEVIVNRLIRARAIAEPVRQYKVVLQGRVFFLDFAWPDELVFVEADGFRYHSTPLHLRRDGRRRNLLAIADWLPLRYTWADATEAADEIADEVREALTLRAHRR